VKIAIPRALDGEEVGQDFHPRVKLAFEYPTGMRHEISLQHRAYRLARKQPKRQVILVSKDVESAHEAKAIEPHCPGLPAAITSGHLDSVSCVRRTNTSVSRIIDRLYAPPHSVEMGELSLDPAPCPTEV